MKNEKYQIINLNWDTIEFKVKSCKVILKDEITINDLDIIKENINKDKYQFITLSNENNNINNNFIISKLNNTNLADINIQLEKETNKLEENNNVIIQNNVKPDNELIQIASKSFKYSRFFTETKLPKNKYDVYVNWTKNSFEKEDKFFAIYKENNIIAGYILFSINNENNLIIELVAVDNRFQHKGIGSKLLQKVEYFANINKIPKMLVGTQINNIEAQNFYIKNGFKPRKVTSIFHWWN